jgi:nucleoside 2-deoxyribosyltransferase
MNMKILTELCYLAAPYHTPEQRAFNQRLAKLMRAYNYPLFMPQELLEALERGEHPFPETSYEEVQEQSPRSLLASISMDMLNRANLVVAVYHGNEFEPATAFEAGYAIARRTNVVAVCSPLSAEEETAVNCGGDTCMSRLETPHLCSQVVMAPYDDESFPDRLIPILNRYFVPHRL